LSSLCRREIETERPSPTIAGSIRNHSAAKPVGVSPAALRLKPAAPIRASWIRIDCAMPGPVDRSLDQEFAQRFRRSPPMSARRYSARRAPPRAFWQSSFYVSPFEESDCPIGGRILAISRPAALGVLGRGKRNRDGMGRVPVSPFARHLL